MMRLHVRAPTGSRIEHTEYLVDQIDRTIRTIIPAAELESISDNIGLPISYDLAFYQTDTIGPQDADVLIQLKPKHRPTAMYEQRIRKALAAKYPEVTAYFQAADIVSQVLNFGLPSAIDAQINGNSLQSDYDIALRLKERMARIPGVVDMRIAEPLDYPSLKVEVDRAKALQFGITQQEVASSVLSSLSGAQLLQPNFWLDPVSGVNYNVIAQARAASVRLDRRAAEYPAQHDRYFVEPTRPSIRPSPARPQRHRSRSCSATSRPSATPGTPPSSRTTPCSAWSTSIAPYPAAISAQSLPRCKGKSATWANFPRAPRS